MNFQDFGRLGTRPFLKFNFIYALHFSLKRVILSDLPICVNIENFVANLSAEIAIVILT